MQILHISADYPDPLAPVKTKAVSNLLALTPELDHKVYSINRVNWSHGVNALAFGEDNRAVTYAAPPLGLFHKTYLDKLADWIIDDIESRRLRPEIVHAHKLSVEALAGEKIAKALNARLVISSQGNSDTKIISVKRDLRDDYKRIWHTADIAFPFAPWTRDTLNQMLGVRTKQTIPLPCPCNQDTILEPRHTGPILRSVFNLTNHKLKNTTLLIEAVQKAARKITDIRLEIVGGGDPRSFAEVSKIAGKAGQNLVSVRGPVPNTDVPDLLNQSGCFVLPSRRESFGMVFTEALLAGCPIVYPHGIAVSGYFSDAPYAIEASNTGADALAETIATACAQENSIKNALAIAHKKNELNFLTRKNIAQTYTAAISSL